MTDLALEYTGGINAPTPANIGFLAIVDSTGRNLRYGHSAAPQAKSPQGVTLTDTTHRFELVPIVYPFDTADATVTPVGTFPVPLNTIVEYRIQYLVRTAGDVLSARWLRGNLINLDGVISVVGATIDEQTAIDPTGIGGVSFTPIVNAIQVNATGKAATVLHWALSLRVVTQMRINR